MTTQHVMAVSANDVKKSIKRVIDFIAPAHNVHGEWRDFEPVVAGRRPAFNSKIYIVSYGFDASGQPVYDQPLLVFVFNTNGKGGTWYVLNENMGPSIAKAVAKVRPYSTKESIVLLDYPEILYLAREGSAAFLARRR